MLVYLASVLVSLYLLFAFWDTRQLRRFRRACGLSRRMHVQMVAKVSNSVFLLNKMKDLCEHVEEEKLLDAYQGCLDMQERMLALLVKNPQLMAKDKELKAAYMFAEGLEKQVEKTFERFSVAIKKQGKSLDRGEKEVLGCYFCSRPYIYGRFKTLKAKVSGVPVKLSTCSFCAEEIKTTGSMKVLYFEVGSEKLHWSKVKTYDPGEDFWRLYEDFFKKRQKLKVVYSKGEEFDSTPQ